MKVFTAWPRRQYSNWAVDQNQRRDEMFISVMPCWSKGNKPAPPSCSPTRKNFPPRLLDNSSPVTVLHLLWLLPFFCTSLAPPNECLLLLYNSLWRLQPLHISCFISWIFSLAKLLYYDPMWKRQRFPGRIWTLSIITCIACLKNVNDLLHFISAFTSAFSHKHINSRVSEHFYYEL